MVWLYWKSYLQSITHQRDPTTNQHENFWLLSFPSGPLRPSLGNLIFSDSSKKAMLMPTLMRTPIQHESIATRTPLLISFHYLTSQTQDYRSTPHSQPMKYSFYFNLRCLRGIGLTYNFNIVKLSKNRIGNQPKWQISEWIWIKPFSSNSLCKNNVKDLFLNIFLFYIIQTTGFNRWHFYWPSYIYIYIYIFVILDLFVSVW